MVRTKQLCLRVLLVLFSVVFLCASVHAFQGTTLIQPGGPVTVPLSSSPCDNPADTPERLITQVYTALREKFGILREASSLQVGTGPLRAYQQFISAAGPVSIEVHQVGCHAVLWICVPHRGLEDGSGPNPAAYLWYQYAKDVATSRFVPVESLLLESTPYPEPDIRPESLYHVYGTWRWAHSKNYDLNNIVLNPGTDPPHWSPIFIGDSELLRGEFRRMHNLMQNADTQSDAVFMLDETVPRESVDLTQRVRHYWPPATLRGLAKSSHISSEDYPGDHTFAYKNGRNVPSGYRWSTSNHYPGWPGQDFDIVVKPDADVHYLGSWYHWNEDYEVEVEIEQFAIEPPIGYRRLWEPIPERFRRFDLSPGSELLSILLGIAPHITPYHPGVGEWVQISGRWVIDCGVQHAKESDDIAAANPTYEVLTRGQHEEEHQTEIHPPELIVTTRLNGGRTEAYAVATGAWQAESLTFAVFPPPRPSLDAVLHYRKRNLAGEEDAYDRQIESALSVEGVPATNPNHVVGIITSTSRDPLGLAETGMVGMTAHRGLECVVECWWEVPTTSITFTIGTLADTPAFNSVIYYRNTMFPDANWSLTPVTPPSRCEPGLISCLSTTIYNLPYGGYVFRPASPDWNFGGGIAGTVPQLRTLDGGYNTLTFAAVSRTLPASLPEWPGFSRSASVFPAEFSGVDDDLTNELLTVRVSPGRLGVQGNALRYAERGSLLVSLQGLAHSERDATAILHPEDAYEDESGIRVPGIPPYILKGWPSNGVSHARVAVSLLLHTSGRTLVADRREYETDDRGFLVVGFSSGSHVEDISLAIEVLDNPFNPWFQPIGETEHIMIYPGATGDDTVPLRLPVLDFSVLRSASLHGPGTARAVKLTAEEAALLEAVEEKREMSGFAFAKILSAKPWLQAQPLAIKLVPNTSTKLPGKLENNWLLMRDPNRAKTLLGDKLMQPARSKPHAPKKIPR